MIHEIIIKNLNYSNFTYVLDNESKKMNVLSKTKSIKFEKGLNVVIGENGSGKSTLINMLSQYTCCTTGETEFIFSPTNEGSIDKLFDIKHRFLNGIEVKNYFSVKVFKLIRFRIIMTI
jgi:ABC-type polysaccharide/polyol phosphate transport system ATPase subunit